MVELGQDLVFQTVESLEKILQKVLNVINHEQSAATGFPPFELFHGKTDNMFFGNGSELLPMFGRLAACSLLATGPDTIFAAEKLQEMYVKARTKMEKRGAKEIARFEYHL